MPNWCSCGLEVTGPKKDLDSFKATLNSTKDDKGEPIEFSFAQTVPPPANMFHGDLSDKDRAECAAKGIPNWYDWNSANYGTKWDVSDAQVQVKPKSVFINFETAWAPPNKWLEAVSKKFPTLSFEMGYCECGMNYYGEMIAEEGNVSESTQDIPSDSFNDEGEVVGKVLKAHIEKWNTGTGG